MKSLDKKKAKELDSFGKIRVKHTTPSGTIYWTDEKPKKRIMKQKPKELDWEKEFDNLNWNTDKGIMTKARVIKQSTGETVGQITIPVTKEMVKTFIKTLLTQQRTELLDEQFEKSETEAEIASKAYDQGYLDCQKGRKKSPHDTRDGYCCACDYDLVCFEGKLKESRTELLEEIKNYFRYKRFGCTDESGKIMADFVLDVVKQEVINLLNKKND